MADPELIKILDYILNRCDAPSLEVIIEAVNRRQRDISLFSAMGGLPDPQRMASDISKRINTGLDNGMDNMRDSVREMIVRIMKEHAPELTEDQIKQLSDEWFPGPENKKSALPRDVLLSMIEQFISYSNGTIKPAVDKNLREEMGEWTKRYWNAFPVLVRRLISDYLKDKITEKEFYSGIDLTLGKE